MSSYRLSLGAHHRLMPFPRLLSCIKMPMRIEEVNLFEPMWWLHVWCWLALVVPLLRDEDLEDEALVVPTKE
jgi:hypothetical protein